MTFKPDSSRFFAPAIPASMALALFTMAHAAGAAQRTSGGTTASGATGGACTVTAGANKGKTGTYTVEEGTGHTWCEGSWGGTDCTGGRCADKSRLIGTVRELSPLTTSKSMTLMIKR